MTKKRVSAILSLLLCGAVILAGCTSNGSRSEGDSANVPSGLVGQGGTPGNSAPAGAGMFVQSIISPQVEGDVRYTDICIQEDGSLLLTGLTLVNEERLPLAFTGDGSGEWAELQNPTATEVISEQMEMNRYMGFTVAADGAWWLATSDMMTMSPEGEPVMPTQPPELMRITADGATQTFDATPSGVSSENANGSMIMRILPGADGGVYVLLTNSNSPYMPCWVTFDGQDGKEICKVELDPQNHTMYDAFVKGSNLFVPNRSSSQVDVFSMLDGSKTESFPIPELNWGMDSISADIAENGDFCYADRGGIHRVAQGGTLVQDMVNDTRFIFASPEFFGMGLLAAADGSYLLLASDNAGADGVYRFVFDETATVSAENSLSVWALADSHVLRAAIAEYSSANPDVYVNVEYGRTGDATGATDADIIRTLNTRLLAGEAPDVLILDGLPASAYIQRDMLTDLTGLIDTNGLYENIMQAYAQDGKVYGYPALFQMPLFMASADDERAGGALTLSDLAALAGEDGALHYGSYIEMFESLYAAYSREIFPNEAAVDEAALRDFLANTKAISDTLALTDENTYAHGGVSNADVMPRQGLHGFIEQADRYAADILWEPVNVSTMFGVNGPAAFSPLPGGAYIPVSGAAIPTGAINAEKAANFIELMINSDAVQNLHMEQGFSVKIGQDSALYDRLAERNGETGERNPANYDWDSLIASFTGPAISERTLYLELYEQAERLYRGEISVDEAVGTVVQNTRLYFEERA